MALTAQDRKFYEERLGFNSFLYVFAATVVIGAVIWPAMLYALDASHGAAASWNSHILFNVSVCGFLLGTVVSLVMYLGFRFLLHMEWLPARRE